MVRSSLHVCRSICHARALRSVRLQESGKLTYGKDLGRPMQDRAEIKDAVCIA